MQVFCLICSHIHSQEATVCEKCGWSFAHEKLPVEQLKPLIEDKRKKWFILQEALEQFENLPALSSVKKYVHQIVDFHHYQKTFSAVSAHVLYWFAFEGNAGTGKTIVGDIIMRIFYALDMVSKKRFSKTRAQDLLSIDTFQMQIRIEEAIRNADGGVLMIDEMQVLGVVYTPEQIRYFLEIVEEKTAHFQGVIIFSGKSFLHYFDAVPSLKEKIHYKIPFHNYQTLALWEIFYQLIVQENYSITKEAEFLLKRYFNFISQRVNFNNGGDIIRLFKKIRKAHIHRIIQEDTSTELMRITEQDIDKVVLNRKFQLSAHIHRITIEDGETGHSYQKLFSNYIKAAPSVTIYEPYLVAKYQFLNFYSFCQLIDSQNGNTHLQLITKEVSDVVYFEKTKEYLANKGVSFSFSLKDDFCARRIVTNNWVIRLSRGLDIFHIPENDEQKIYQYKRKCKPTTICIESKD